MPALPGIALIVAPIVALTITAMPSSAQRLDAHQHGAGHAQLAVERGRVSLLAEIPGFNLVGFEHPPKTDAEVGAIDRAAARLAGGAWLRVPPGADCRSERLDVRVRGYREAPGQQDPDADHDHGHEPAHAHEPHPAHASFTIEAALECARPAALDWIELALFDDWHDQRLLRVDVLTESGARRVELRPGTERVELQ